jgi:hypothetical protein
MKTCPKCGATHEKAGKFCSRECANSRTWNEEDKAKKSVGAKRFYQTEAGEINRWEKGKRNSRFGFRPMSDPKAQDAVEFDYIVPENLQPDESQFISGGDVWFVDE